MTRRRTAIVRLAALTAAVALASCRRGQAPRATPAPSRPDTAPRPIAVDTGARRDTAPSRRDTVASAARDSGVRRAPTNRRREPEDPSRRCGKVNIEETPTSRLNALQDASGKYVSYVGGNVVVHCTGVNNRLASDSAESYETQGQLILINNVSYDEPNRVRLTSNRLTYFQREERLVAEGNVNVTLPSGTTLVGPRAEYYRAVPSIRPGSRLAADGRPTLRVIGRPAPRGRDSARANAPTQPDTGTIIANLIIDENDSLVFASGQVQIIRTDVVANSDSATFDQGTEAARLLRNARIEGQRGRPFTLSGALVDLFSRDRDLSRIVSRGDAHVVSKELDLKSDTVDLRVRDNRVERAYAWGPSRATATSPQQDVVADSIEAILPEQRIRELHAVRRAIARSLPDSTKIVSNERDLLAGDTIVARFDTLAAARDTTTNPPVREIVADGHASSLYQIANGPARTAKPGVNYVKGRRITVAFDSGQVHTVTVTDSATGVYLDPSDSTADSSATRARRSTQPRSGQPAPRPASVIPGRRPPTSRQDESRVIPFVDRSPLRRRHE